MPTERPEEFVVGTHADLFVGDETPRCDACNEPLATGDDDDGYGVRGSGTYLWARGDQMRLERALLCASCAAAIGMTALLRWEIEEEEG